MNEILLGADVSKLDCDKMKYEIRYQQIHVMLKTFFYI